MKAFNARSSLVLTPKQRLIRSVLDALEAGETLTSTSFHGLTKGLTRMKASEIELLLGAVKLHKVRTSGPETEAELVL